MLRIGKTALLGTTSKFCSIGTGNGGGMFGNWMGQNDSKPGGSGSGNQTQVSDNDTSAGDDPALKNDKKNDSGNDDSLVDDIWKSEVDDGPDGGKKGNKGAKDDEPAGGSPAQRSEEEQVADYLKKNGMAPIVLTEGQIEQLKSGEGFPEILAQINTQIAQSHLKGLSSTNLLIKSEVAKAVERAVGESATLLRDDKARAALNAEMPWTSNGDFKPLAESVLKRFLDKSGNDIPKSVKLTKIYFQRQQQAMDPTARSNTNLGGNNRQRSPQAPGDVDFSALLKGK